MNDELRTHINRAFDALFELNDAADCLDAAAIAALGADTALRDAKASMDDLESVLLLEATRSGALDGKNAETRDAQFRSYRASIVDWTEAADAHHVATVGAARARQQAESAAARFSVAKEAVRLHTAIVGLLGRA